MQQVICQLKKKTNSFTNITSIFFQYKNNNNDETQFNWYMYNRDGSIYTVLMKYYVFEKRIFNTRVDDTKVYFYKVFF